MLVSNHLNKMESFTERECQVVFKQLNACSESRTGHILGEMEEEETYKEEEK